MKQSAGSEPDDKTHGAGGKQTRMCTVSLRVPDSLHARLKILAERDGISIHQFVTSAVAEKLSALTTQEYLAERAKRGSREKLMSMLAKVPDVPADPGDEL